MQSQSLFQRSVGVAISVIAVAMVVYQLATLFSLFVGPNEQQVVHLAFALVLVFLNYMRRARGRRWITLLAALYIVLTLLSLSYSFLNVPYLEFYMGDPGLPVIYVWIGVVLVFLSLEATRQSFEWTIPVSALLFLAYAYLSNYLPGPLYGPAVSLERLFLRLGVGALGVNGIFGPILSISANTIFLFFIYSSLLQATGGSRFFMQIGRLIGKKLAGGPAMTAVVSSALVGMVTGSVSANVTLTGSFTIPLMKKVGYQPHQAAAIEAVASTGGQIMPPVMGLVAFLMVGMTGIPYTKIMVMALVPSLLYFLSAGLYAQFQAMKWNMRKVDDAEDTRVDFREMILFGPLFVLPLLFLIVLLVVGRSVGFSVGLTIISLVVLSLLRKQTRISPGKWIQGVADGAVAGSAIAVTCAVIGLILASISFTVLFPKIPSMLVSLAGDRLLPILALGAAASILLGMGASTSVAYILVALVISPVLVKMGVTTGQAHFFALYYAVLGFITPPVAIGPMVASKLANADFVRTGIESCKVALGSFIVPFLFMYQPVLLLQASGRGPLLDIAVVVACTALIVVLQVVVCSQYVITIHTRERYLFGLIAAALFTSLVLNNFLVMAAALAGLALVSVWQVKRKRALARFT